MVIASFSGSMCSTDWIPSVLGQLGTEISLRVWIKRRDHVKAPCLDIECQWTPEPAAKWTWFLSDYIFLVPRRRIGARIFQGLSFG